MQNWFHEAGSNWRFDRFDILHFGSVKVFQQYDI